MQSERRSTRSPRPWVTPPTSFAAFGNRQALEPCSPAGRARWSRLLSACSSVVCVRRSATALLGLLLGLAALAIPALAKSGTLTFTTGSFVVTCTSTGELCTPAEHLSVVLPRKGTLVSVAYTTAKTHCSTVEVFVRLHGKTVATVPPLAAGAATSKIKTNVKLKQGKTTLGFQAKGFTGGCNAGLLGSWGGKATVKVSLG
jgi:hypothetical protein